MESSSSFIKIWLVIIASLATNADMEKKKKYSSVKVAKRQRKRKESQFKLLEMFLKTSWSIQQSTLQWFRKFSGPLFIYMIIILKFYMDFLAKLRRNAAKHFAKR